MTLKPSIIPAGNVALRGFEQDGVFRQSQGIESYYRLAYNGNLPTNEPVSFLLQNNLHLLSLWIVSLNNPIQNTDTFTVSYSSVAHSFSNGVDIACGPFKLNDGVVVWQPPLIILESGLLITLNFSFDVSQLSFFAKAADLYPVILGQR